MDATPRFSTVPDMKLFAGNATPVLAQRIANRLYMSLGDATVSRFLTVKCVYKSMKTYGVATYSLSSRLVRLPMTT